MNEPGLIQTAMPQQPMPQQQGPQPSQGAPPQGAPPQGAPQEGQRSPLQQQLSGEPSSNDPNDDLKLYVARGLELISSPKTRDGVLSMLKTKAKNPVQALADVLVLIMRKVDAAARSKGIEVQDTVKMAGAHELMTELANVGKAARLIELDDDHILLAFSTAIQEYVKGEITAGRINPKKLMAQVQSSTNKLPPEEQAKAKETVQRIAATGQKYSGGQQNGPTR